MNIRELLERNPVIPAINDENTFKAALESNNELVFIISANLIDIEYMVKKLMDQNKIVFIHIDMIEGLSNSNYVVDYIANKIKPNGIITTKQNIAIHSLKLNLNVIRRFFILDSFSLKRTLSAMEENRYTAIEIMPGLMPKIISRISKTTNQPIITGGLIEDKEDIINALNAGALSVSTTCSSLWES